MLTRCWGVDIINLGSLSSGAEEDAEDCGVGFGSENFAREVEEDEEELGSLITKWCRLSSCPLGVCYHPISRISSIAVEWSSAAAALSRHHRAHHHSSSCDILPR